LEDQIAQRQSDIRILKQLLSEKDAEIARLHKQIYELRSQQLSQDEQLSTDGLKQRIKELKQELLEEIEERKRLDDEHESSLRTIRELRTQLSEQASSGRPPSPPPPAAPGINMGKTKSPGAEPSTRKLGSKRRITHHLSRSRNKGFLPLDIVTTKEYL